MRNKITLFVILAIVTVAFVAGNFTDKTYRNDKMTKSLNFNTNVEKKLESDGNVPHVNIKPTQNSVSDMVPPPADSVPGLTGFNDYATNGNSLSQIIVSGDTIIVTCPYLDSLEVGNPNAGTTLRIRYNTSLDGGLTWLGFVEMANDQKCRYPDGSLVTVGGQRTFGVTGRYWAPPANSATRRPGGAFDVVLGAGAPTINLLATGLTAGTDLFSTLRNDGKIGCLVQAQNTTNDSLLYTTWDLNAGTYSALKVVDTRVLSNTVMAYNIGASSNANHMTAAWSYVNEPTSGGDPIRSVRYSSSTDGGNTWAAPQKILANAFINGDSTHCYWHTEVAYKPNTSTPYVCFSTYDYTGYVSLTDQRRAWKIVLWAPTVNGGNPVVVADWHNVPFMADTNNWGVMIRSNGTRPLFGVNEAVFGHPSIGFSADGSVLYCTYSVVQPDTATSVAGQNWNFHDVYLSYSLDGGATWSATAQNVSNTAAWDEVYPVVAARNNTNTRAYITYMSTKEPGCAVFTDLSPSAKVYQVFKKVLTPIGIVNISNEIPEKYSLAQNFPNPFNPTTKIRFALPKDANVTLQVYNAVGQLVAVLANNEFVKAGSKEITFDAASFASGVYFYSIKAGDFTETKKMVLVK